MGSPKKELDIDIKITNEKGSDNINVKASGNEIKIIHATAETLLMLIKNLKEKNLEIATLQAAILYLISRSLDEDIMSQKDKKQLIKDITELK